MTKLQRLEMENKVLRESVEQVRVILNEENQGVEFHSARQLGKITCIVSKEHIEREIKEEEWWFRNGRNEM